MRQSCPLCSANSIVPSSEVEIQPILSHWLSIGIDVSYLVPKDAKKLSILRCLECDLNFYTPFVIGDANLYKNLSKHEWYYSQNKWEYDVVINYLYKTAGIESLMEVGCGSGFFLEKARNIINEVEGVELNSEAIKVATQKGLTVTDNNFLDLTKTYDAIISFQVLEHLEAPGEMIKGMIERLKPNGKLIIAVPNQNGILGHLKHNYLNMPPHHLTLWSEMTMKKFADIFNLNLVEYYTEPLSIEMYIALRDDYLKSIQQTSGMFNRLLNKLTGVILDGTVVADFLSAKKEVLGHSHLAIYER